MTDVREKLKPRWPDLYIRGCRGLARQVKDVFEKSDGTLQYIGQWHSHPDGYSTSPSTDDHKVFDWIKQRVEREGYPPVMLIAGESGVLNCFLAKAEPKQVQVGQVQ